MHLPLGAWNFYPTYISFLKSTHSLKWYFEKILFLGNAAALIDFIFL